MGKITATGNFPDLGMLEKFLEKKAILSLLPNLELYQFGREAIVPSNAGKEIYIPRWFDRSTKAGKPVERSGIATSSMSGGRVSGSLAEYEKTFKLGRFLFSTKSVPILAEATKQLMLSVAKGWEEDIQKAISSDADMSAANANGITMWTAADGSTATGSVVEGTYMKARALSVTNAKLRQQYNPGFAEFGGNYGALLHSNAIHHLRVNVSGGASVTFEQQSMDRTQVFSGRPIGDLFSTRIFESAFSSKLLYHATAIANAGGMRSANSGYLQYVFAPEAFAVAPLANARPEINLRGFGELGANNVNRRFAYLGAYGVFDAFTKAGNTGIKNTRMCQIAVSKTL